MRWAAWLLRSAAPSRLPAGRTRLAVQPLEGREVPSTTMGPDPTSAAVPVQVKPPAPFPQIGDRVWKDLNGNGLQDPGEPGIAGVTLQLYQGNKLVGTTVTDGLGTYAFNAWNVTNGTTDTADDGLVAGTAYQIRVAGDQPTLVGLRPTTANAGADDFHDSDAVGGVLDFTMGPDELYSHYDLGYSAAASIGDLVWSDTNNNGIKDGNEAGLPGVAVRLLDATGTTEVARTTTGTDGTYQFNGLMPGTYIVEIAKSNFATGGALYGSTSSTGTSGRPTGPYEGSKTPDPNVGRRGVYDHGSTLDGAVRCKPVTVSDGTLTNQSVDFGFFRSGNLAGKVFVDLNANGRIDAEDTAGLTGVKITAAGPAGVFTTTTDATGSYSFTNLPAGNYTVTEAQPRGYKSSTPDLVTAAVGLTGPAAVNFGEAQAVDLAVTLAAPPASVVIGNTLTLTYRVRNVGTKDASGVTLLAPLPPGLKILTVTQTGGTFDKTTQRATIPTLAVGAEAVFTIRVRATQTGLHRLTATVQGTDAEDVVRNNRSVVSVWVVPFAAPPVVPQQTALLMSAFRR